MDDIIDLKKKCERLKLRLTEAQARNYDLRNEGKPEPSLADLKSRVDWLEAEIKRVVRQRDELRRQLGDKANV